MVLSGEEYRAKGRERMKRFKELQEKRGYQQVAVYISRAFREEIEQLKCTQKLNTQEALEHIFNVYLNVKSNAPNNINLTSTKSEPVIPMSLIEPAPLPPKTLITSPPNPQPAPINIEPQRLSIEELDKVVIEVVAQMPLFKDRAAELNRRGIHKPTRKGLQPWTADSLRGYMGNVTSRQKAK
jgi:hypothetical protein